MIGKVVEGRYAGAEVHRLPDKNVLFLRTENDTRIALSKKNVISIDDVTDQYPDYGRKVMMVMWTDFETSILQLGSAPAAPRKEEADTSHEIVRQVPPAKKKSPAGKIVVFALVVLLLAGAAFAALKFLPGRDVATAETTAPETTEPAVTETTVATEPSVPTVDEEFLADIELSVTKRMSMAGEDDNSTSYYQSLVNTELAIVGKYREEEFQDAALQTLACQYIDGLYLQNESLQLTYSEHQIKWQEGLVCRYEALVGLHEQYGIFQDNTEFITSYVMDLPGAREHLEALRAIEADLIAQLDGITLQYASQNYGYTMYTNNTDYDFDVNFYFWYYDRNEVRIDEWRTGVSNLKSGETNKLTFYCPGSAYRFEYFWNIYPNP